MVEHLNVVVSLGLNICSSVGVILINKRLVFMEAGFTFGTLLTIIHFIVTFAGCVFFSYTGHFTPRATRVRGVLPLCLAFCGYVVFNNLSLLTNSVSVYQVSKLFCTPVIVGIERYVYGVRESRRTLVSLVPVVLGALLTVFTDAALSAWGVLWCVLAVASNSLYTVWGKTKQAELGLEPMQLLMYQAPISAALLIVFGLPCERLEHLATYTVTATTVWTVGLSCVFAFGVNFSFFLLARATSPLTVNVVGYFKTALVFVLGLLFVDQHASAKVLLGIATTLAGLALYTREKVREAERRVRDARETTVQKDKNNDDRV